MRKHILFDLDGTLTDPMVGITSSVQYALSRFGIEVKYLKELIPFIGPPLSESFEKYYGFTPGQAKTAVEYYREYFSPTGIFENEIYPGIAFLLEELKDAGYPLYLATSKPKIYAERILKHFGIDGFFSYVGGSELDGTRTQKKDVISHVLWECGIPAADAVMVGDRRHDIEGARVCGVFSVGVLYGYGSEDELKKAGASRIAVSVDELKRFLLGQDEEKEDHSLIRFGIIGTGKRAEDFFRANRFSHGFELTAVYDEDMEKAKEFGFRKGNLVFYDDLEEFASDRMVDAVFIASPCCFHYDQAMTVMKAGKHVLCGMPLAASVKEAEAMFDAAAGEEVILMEAVYPVYTPGFQNMTRYMDSLGTIRQAVLQHCRYSPEYDREKRGFFSDPFNGKDAGGALMETGACPVACMVQLFGEPKRVAAAGIMTEPGGHGAGSILMEYEDMVGQVIYSDISDAAVPSQIQGEDASMMIREIENIRDLRILRKNVNQTVHFEQSDNSMNHVAWSFMKSVRTGSGWETARDNTLKTIRILEEAGQQIRREEA